MNKSNKFQKFDFKPTKKKSGYIEEDNIPFKEIKRDRSQKQYRNFDNALRSKNLDRLLSYDEE
jgi:phage terminase large subunit-like protein